MLSFATRLGLLCRFLLVALLLFRPLLLLLKLSLWVLYRLSSRCVSFSSSFGSSPSLPPFTRSGGMAYVQLTVLYAHCPPLSFQCSLFANSAVLAHSFRCFSALLCFSCACFPSFLSFVLPSFVVSLVEALSPTFASEGMSEHEDSTGRSCSLSCVTCHCSTSSSHVYSSLHSSSFLCSHCFFSKFSFHLRVGLLSAPFFLLTENFSLLSSPLRAQSCTPVRDVLCQISICIIYCLYQSNSSLRPPSSN